MATGIHRIIATSGTTDTTPGLPMKERFGLPHAMSHDSFMRAIGSPASASFGMITVGTKIKGTAIMTAARATTARARATGDRIRSLTALGQLTTYGLPSDY